MGVEHYVDMNSIISFRIDKFTVVLNALLYAYTVFDFSGREQGYTLPGHGRREYRVTDDSRIHTHTFSTRKRVLIFRLTYLMSVV